MFHFTLFDHNHTSKDLMGKSTAGELLKSEAHSFSEIQFSEKETSQKNKNFSKK